MHHTQGGLFAMPARRALLIGGVVVLGALAVGRRRIGPVRVQVDGTSMSPALEPGDRLLVRPARRLRPGDIVSLPDPRDPSRTLIKRVHALLGDCVDVRGDNPTASTDSRSLGLLARSSVSGVAVYRYHPPARVGRLGR